MPPLPGAPPTSRLSVLCALVLCSGCSGALATLLEPIPTTEPSAHTGAVAIQFEPAFAACDGLAYTEREDGGCEVAVVGTVTLGASGSPRVGFIGRVFETETWMGTEDAIRIDLDAVEIQPE